jgi:murein DD-endopeptidase MepM/ murein hydrolase activator NlpD
VVGKIGKWGQRLFSERQILLRSEGRVRYVTLTRRAQLAVAVASIALIGYAAFNTFTLDRGLTGKRPETTPVLPAEGAWQARINELERQLAATRAQLSQAGKPEETSASPPRALAEQFEARIRALQDERDRAVADQQELQRQLVAAQQATDAKSQSLAQINRTLEAKSGELKQSDQQRMALQNRVQALQSELDAAKANLEGLAKRLRQLASERDKALTEHEAMAAPSPAPQRVVPGLTNAPAEDGTALDALSEPPPLRSPSERRPDQRSEGTGELEQLIASTGIDVEELLDRLDAVPPNQGGPYMVLDNVAAPPPPNVQRSQELQAIVKMLPLAAPLDDYRTESGFGARTDPFTHRQAFHPGLDLVAPYRTPVYSTAPGVVIFTGAKSAYGKVVEIDHGHGIITLYGHLHRTVVTRGQQVSVHQEVGELGSTGRSTGPHLHYEVVVNGTPQDPAKFLQAGKDVIQKVSGN